MYLPEDKPLPGKVEKSPMVIIGDEAFSLKTYYETYYVKPFPRRQSRNDRKKDTYNYRLCRARRVVENAFGILAKKWRVFDRTMEMQETTVKKVIMATCILHNYLRVQNCNNYDNELESDEESFLLRNNIANIPRRCSIEAFRVREHFVEYFNDE